MIHKIWFNIQRLYYSLKGLDYKGTMDGTNFLYGKTVIIYKKGELITISGVLGMEELNGVYKVI